MAGRRAGVVAAAVVALVGVACGGSGPHLGQGALDTPVAGPSALGDGTVHDTAGGYAALVFTAPDQEARASAALNAAIVLAQDSDQPPQPMLEFAAAAARPGGTDAVAATYLLGRALAANDPEAAARTLKPVVSTKDPGALTPYVVAAYASALQASGHAGDAAKQWKALLNLPSPPSSLEQQAYRGLASATKGADRIAWLTKLAQATEAPTDRLELGLAAQREGDTKTFREQLRQVITSDPGTHEAVLAVQALHAANVPVDPGDEGLVDYRHSDFVAAEKVLAPSIDAPGVTPEQRTFRLYYLSATYESQGKADQAITFYDKAATTGASSPFVHRARYWAAEVMETTGDVQDASARYAALAKDGPAGEFSATAAFQAGYLLLKDGDPAAAVATWDSLGMSTDPKLLYWRGRAASLAGMSSEAAAAFEAAAKAGPFDFYGIEAKALLDGTKPDVSYRDRDLDAPIDWDAVEDWLEKLKGDGSLPGPQTAAAELAAMGARAQARQALLDAGDSADAWQMLGLVREARDAGMFDASATLMARLVGKFGVSDTELPRAVLQLEYPVAYVSSLQRVAKTEDIDPLFLAAAIYQESLWNPGAGSAAGAIGLLQLIGSTGEEVANQMGLRNVTPADLFQPVVNLELGAHFLAQQLEAFGDPALALAAYNAGPGNAARWQAEWDGADAATLVDTMDYNETSGYVTQIAQWYALYQAAYG